MDRMTERLKRNICLLLLSLSLSFSLSLSLEYAVLDNLHGWSAHYQSHPHSILHCNALLFLKKHMRDRCEREIARFKGALRQIEVKSHKRTHTRVRGNESAWPHLPRPPSTSLIVMVTISTSAASCIHVFTPHAATLYITPSSFFMYSCLLVKNVLSPALSWAPLFFTLNHPYIQCLKLSIMKY